MQNKNQLAFAIECFLLSAMLGGAAGSLPAQPVPQFAGVQHLTNNEALLKLTAPAGLNFRIDASTNLVRWDFLATLRSAGSIQHTDSAAPFLVSRFYRAVQLTETNGVTGDHQATDDGDILIHPINHASFIMVWNGKTIYSDPVGGAARFQGLPRADLILVTHTHTDHFDAATINAVKATNAVIIAPASVFQSLSAALKTITGIQANGDTTNLLGLSVEAVPMYNLTTAYHLKGAGNGYVLTVGGRRIYISGDTEDIPEMRALRGIDVAFVCMNLPFTMPVDKAANAVREFRPGVIYPYHYQGSDVNKFKQLVGTDLGIEVRLRKWY